MTDLEDVIQKKETNHALLKKQIDANEKFKQEVECSFLSVFKCMSV